MAITLEQLKKALGDDKDAFKINKDADHTMIALNLLRSKIPYKECKSIVQGASHDQIFLTYVDDVLEYLDERDLVILADCNCGFDLDTDSLYMFV